MTPERIEEIAGNYAQKHCEQPYLSALQVIKEAITEAIEEETSRFRAIEKVFTEIAEYLGVQQGDVPGLLEEITMLKESAELLNRMADLIETLRPFVDAFENIKEHHISDNVELQEFKDSNLQTPTMTIGHFRKLHEAYNKLMRV